jgi:2',3'-cyclic-nucleotide 2'-phosphodiesterase
VSETQTVLILGDIIGRSGSRAVFTHLKQLIKQTRADFVVVNAENATEGFGLTPEVVENLFTAGANVITTGNHVWQQREIFRILNDEPRLLRPANYPPDAPGHGFWSDSGDSGIAVMNLQGRRRMIPTDCPFRKAKELIKAVPGKAHIVIVDFHAEATEEKEALAHYLDGQVTVVVGTHTHIPTNDARILPRGTALQTDLGSSGPADSVIGFKSEISVRRALTQLPLRNEVSDNPAVINGVVVVADRKSGHARSIERLTFRSSF